jgi:hypothetical protein
MSGQAIYTKLLSILDTESEGYRLKTAAARSIRYYRELESTEVLIKVLQEHPPTFPFIQNSEIPRDWAQNGRNISILVNAIGQTTDYYKMRISALKTLIKIGTNGLTNLIIQELKFSFKIDPINLYVRRVLYLISPTFRRILNKKCFDMNKMKVGFQKEAVHALGDLKDIQAIDLLFKIYTQGTSRLWKEVLDALNKIDSNDALNLLFQRYLESPSRKVQNSFLNKLFFTRDIIALLPLFDRDIYSLFYEVLLFQGPENLEKLEFIKENTSNKELNAFLREIIPFLQAIIPQANGFSLLL